MNSNLKHGGELKLVRAYEYKEQVKDLFTEYMNMLIKGDSMFIKYMELQNYDDEIAHLDVKYREPENRLYLLYVDDLLAGSIGMLKFDEHSCELKRLYLKPEFRGRGLGDFLVSKIIKDAHEAGYEYMLLDTMPFLDKAYSLYKKHGFYDIPKYNDSPMEVSYFMRLDL